MRWPSEAFTLALPTGFDADAVLTREGRHSRLNVRDGGDRPHRGDRPLGGAAVADAGEGSTPERLRAAADASVLGAEQAETLTEAFELALELRIVHQLEQIAAGAGTGRPARRRGDERR